MKQKKLCVKVIGADGLVIREISTASAETILAALQLFNEVGTKIVCQIVEVELSNQPSN